MKISMWSSYYGEIHPEDMVLEYEKHGIAYGELSTEHSALLLDRGDPFEVGKAFRAFAEKHNVKFLQGHLELSTKVCEESERDFLKKELDLYHAIGITRAVLHVDMLARYGEIPVEEIRQRNLEGIRDVGLVEREIQVPYLSAIPGLSTKSYCQNVYSFGHYMGCAYVTDTGHPFRESDYPLMDHFFRFFLNAFVCQSNALL